MLGPPGWTDLNAKEKTCVLCQFGWKVKRTPEHRLCPRLDMGVHPEREDCFRIKLFSPEIFTGSPIRSRKADTST